MSRLMRWTTACLAGFVMSLSISSPEAWAGTVSGVAVKLNGDPNAAVTVSTGVDTKITDAKGAFSITTPNVRPFTLTLSKGDLVVRVENLDGFSAHTLTVVVPDLTEMAPPCPPVVLYQPCYEVSRHRWFFRHR
jgi:hypothetical protein